MGQCGSNPPNEELGLPEIDRAAVSENSRVGFSCKKRIRLGNGLATDPMICGQD